MEALKKIEKDYAVAGLERVVADLQKRKSLFSSEEGKELLSQAIAALQVVIEMPE